MFHPGDLINPAVCFKHIDDQSVMGTVIDGVSGQPVAWHSVQRNSFEASAKPLSRTKESLFQFLNRFLVQMKPLSFGQIHITEKDESGKIDSPGADQSSIVGEERFHNAASCQKRQFRSGPDTAEASRMPCQRIGQESSKLGTRMRPGRYTHRSPRPRFGRSCPDT